MFSPIQGSNRKRTALQQPEALLTASKLTKHEKPSENLDIIAISDMDSDAPSASTSSVRLQRSPIIKVEDAFGPRLNTPKSRPPDEGVLGPDTLEDGVASSTGTRVKPTNAPKPDVQIQYFIVTARTARFAYTLWPEETLRDKTPGEICDEIGKYTSKRHAQKIVFKMSISQVEMKYPICRGDENTFEDTRRALNRGLGANRKKSIMIWLDPDPAGQRSTEVEVVEGSESEDDIV